MNLQGVNLQGVKLQGVKLQGARAWLMLLLLMLFPGHCLGQELQEAMGGVFEAFKKLQPYITGAAELEGKQAELAHAVDSLRSELDAAESVHEFKRRGESAAVRLQIVEALLDEAVAGLREGSDRWALLRLQTVSNHCLGCHQEQDATVNLIATQDLSEQRLLQKSAFRRGEFFLISRRFEEAKKAYLEAAAQSEQQALRLAALKKWLYLQTRFAEAPEEGLESLQRLKNRAGWGRFEKSLIEEWISSFKDWVEEKPRDETSLEQAERLLLHGLEIDDPILSRIGTVELLRAARLLHETLEKEPAKPRERQPARDQERRKALYLLGLVYSKIPSFYINELPEVYLEQLIREYPGTEEAKRAYRLYRELYTFSYTFGNETEIPNEIRRSLQELEKLAYQ